MLQGTTGPLRSMFLDFLIHREKKKHRELHKMRRQTNTSPMKEQDKATAKEQHKTETNKMPNK